jgi:hypothetical protein
LSVVAETFVRVRAETSGVVQQVEETGSRAGRAFAAAFNRSSRGAGATAAREINQVERGALAGSGAFRSLGRSVAYASGLFLGTAKAVDLVRDSLHGAADEQKQVERGQALFGQRQQMVHQFAQQAAKSLGLADNAAQQFTDDLGQMLVPLGIAPSKAAGLSVELTKLVGNLSSMRNEDPTVVLNKIEAGLRGRGMGLKAYGIQINDVTLKEEALRLGLVKTEVSAAKVGATRTKLAIATAQLRAAEDKYGAGTTQVAKAQLAVQAAQLAVNKAIDGSVPKLTQQQKSLAATNIILQQGSRYSGEFAKHHDDLANKERTLNAEVNNLKDTLGYALFPAMNKVVGGIADWLAKDENMARAQKAINDTVRESGKLFGAAWSVIRTGVSIIKPVVDAVGGLGNAIKLVLAIKLAMWVDSVVVPALTRSALAWKADGAAATVAATETKAATTAIASDMAVLANSTSTLAVKNEVAAIGTAAGTAAGSVGSLKTGLLNLSKGGVLASIAAVALGLGDLFSKVKGGGTASIAGAGRTFDVGTPTSSVPLFNAIGVGGKTGLPTNTDLAPSKWKIVYRDGEFYAKVAGKYYPISEIVAAKALGVTPAQLDRMLSSAGASAPGSGSVPLTSAGGLVAGIKTSPGSGYHGSPDLVGPRTAGNRVGGPTPGLQALQNFLVAAGDQGGSPAINVPGGTHVAGSFHWRGEALDIGDGSGSEGSGTPDNPRSLVATWNTLVAHVDHLAELFWNYGGFYKWGQRIGGPGSDKVPNHRKHIHVAFTGSPQEVAKVFGIQSPGGSSAARSASAARRGASGIGEVTSGEIAAAAAATGLDAGLIRAVLAQESGGHQGAKSTAGARGVMQLMNPSSLAAQNTAAGRRANLMEGAKFLAEMLTKYGNVELALIAYNWGPGNLDAYLKRHSGILSLGDKAIPKETRDYVRSILGPHAQATVAPGQASTYGLGDLVVGVPPKKPPPPGMPLANDLAVAQRAVVRARAGGGTALEEAIRAEQAVDRRIIKATQELGRTGKMKTATVQRIIRERQADIASLDAQIAALHKREAAAAKKQQVHEDLVKDVIGGLGIGDSVLATRAYDEIAKRYRAMTNTALKAILREQAKARTQLKTAIKTAQATEGSAADIISTLLGSPDQALAVTFQDKWGRTIKTTIAGVVADAQKALRDLEAALASGNKAAILAAVNEWKTLGPEIKAAVDANLDAATQAAQARQTAFETQFGRAEDQILDAFDRETQATIQGMQDSLSAQITALNDQMNAEIARIQRDAAKLTPAEAALKKLEDKHSALLRSRSLGDSSMSLATAQRKFAEFTQAGVGGLVNGQIVSQDDIQQAADAMVNAQRALDDALFDQKDAALQKQAQQQRAARDAETQAQIEAIQKRTEAQVAALQEQERANEANYQDQRRLARQDLQDTLDDWKTKLETGKASWGDFLNWLHGQSFNSKATGGGLGQAFADGYIEQLNRAYAAQQALINGQDPAAAAASVKITGAHGTGTHAHPGGPGGIPEFATGGEVPGPFSGRDDRLALLSGGETVIDRRLTDALKKVFLGGGSSVDGDKAVDVLLALLTEQRKQTGLLGEPPVVNVHGSDMNAAVARASR